MRGSRFDLSALSHAELVMPRESGASSTPRPLDFNISNSGILDRPLSRAMTAGDTPLHSRGAMRPSCCPNYPLKNRGRRESRVLDAPAASRAKVIKHTSVVTTGSPKTSGLPCAMVLTAYFVLSPVTGLFCHRRLRLNHPQLDTSVGASGPHDFAVRISAARLASLSRPPHPAPNVRDDREAPLLVRTGRRGICR
jgi:hypothetical protein